jgi:hypothetical protein
MTSPSLTIVLSGMIAGDPHQGGATWAVLQYALGLQELGHRVLLIEPIDSSQVQPRDVALEESTNATYFQQVTSDFGLEDCAALHAVGSRTTVGLPYDRCLQMAAQADVLLNISGMLTDENILSRIPVRAYLDLDPAFVQCWHAQGINMRFEGHTHFVTIGLAIGEPDCPVPTAGLQWIKTLQPVVLSRWPVAEEIRYDGLTTIGNWRGYGSVEHKGVHYGQKAHSLRPLFRLPSRTREPFLLALAIHPRETDDLAQLHRFGWQLLDPAEVASTPLSYQRFIQRSKAEFGIAKSGYVHSRCGWFSDRSVCYLASGRPVISQQTGFSRYLPTGTGLLEFTTADDVLGAIDALSSNYEQHRRAAREIAEAHFASNRVLPRLLEQLGGQP